MTCDVSGIALWRCSALRQARLYIIRVGTCQPTFDSPPYPERTRCRHHAVLSPVVTRGPCANARCSRGLRNAFLRAGSSGPFTMRQPRKCGAAARPRWRAAVPGVVEWLDGMHRLQSRCRRSSRESCAVCRDPVLGFRVETLDWSRRLGVYAAACSESRCSSRLHRAVHSPQEKVLTLRRTSAVDS